MMTRIISTITYSVKEGLGWMMDKYRILLMAVLWLACWIPDARAQLKASFKHYSTEDGLSHDGVLCITKDKEGFMWFGTWDGINRFDGHVFTAYKAHPGDSSNLKNNKIRTIVEDKPGYLWVKTYDNLVYRFDKKKEKFWSVPGNNKAYQDMEIDQIIPAATGDTWLVPAGEGLLCAVNVESSPIPQLYEYGSNLRGDFRLPGSSVNFLFEDHQNRTWVGTTNGISCMVKRNGKYYQKVIFNDKKDFFGPQYSFTCAAEANGTIYFGTSSGTLVAFNTRQSTFKTYPLAPGTQLNAVCPSKSGLLYISTTGKGFLTVDLARSTTKYASLPGMSSFFTLYEDREGRIWIEPEKSGIVKYDPKNGSFKFYTQKKDANVVSPNKNYNVFEDMNGVLWASLKGGGFGYYDAASDAIAYFHNEPGSSTQQFSNIVTALYADRAGILWLSGNDGGINKILFHGNNFTHQLLVSATQNKSENEVRSLFEDSHGKLWVGTKAGHLYLFNHGKIDNTAFVNLPGAEVGSVYSIMEARDGTIWLGTKGDGLLMAQPVNADHSKYKLTRFKHERLDPYSISSNMVYAVLQDKKGRIWAGTLGGGLNKIEKQGDKIIFRNSDNAFKKYPASCNVIRHLQEGPSGRIWISTTDGLVLFNPDEGDPVTYRFSKYSKIPGDPASLGNNDVQFVHRDRTGQMWVGTFGGGLNKVISPTGSAKLRFRIFTKEDGLPNDIMLSMVDDNQGNLWLATENGLSEYDAVSQTFKNYDSYDGLPETGFSEAAAFKSRSGDLFFGCVKGFISFNPLHISNRKLIAGMALTSLQLYNKDIIAGAPGSPLKYSLNNTDRITLDYDQNVVSIDYTVLDYRASHKIAYAYILKGYDKGWHYVKNQRKATYTHLPPGDYVFAVKSTSNDLFNNMPLKSVMITVLPPPWLTIWAYLIYMILAVVLIEIARRIIVTMIRLRNQVAVEHRLTDLKLQFFTNVSHELRTPLTLIVSPLEELARTEKISARGRENIGIVNRNANRMIRFINQLLDFRKIQSGKMRLKISEIEIVGLIREISRYFTGLAHEKNIDLQISTDVEELQVWIDEEKIDIVIYNLLSNAFKFSSSDKVIRIHIGYVPGEEDFTITITDQGYGVPKQKLAKIFELYYEGDKTSENNLKGTGIGLALSKELIQAHHGDIQAKNNPDGGMIFSIRLRTGKAHFEPNETDFIDSPALSGFINPGYIENNGSGLQNGFTQKEQQAAADRQLVLLVEDNSELRGFLANQLSAFYRIKEARDGEEGLKIALESLPDLIISDWMMPNMDGMQMLDQLKNNETTSHIPVILLTAKSSVESQVEGLRYGADFYITKPFHTDHILASVENLLKQRKSLFESMVNRDRKQVRLSPGEVMITSRDEAFLKDMIRIVEEGMEDSEFNIDHVAEAIGMGRTTFYKKLKSLTGFAPVEFVRDMRLQRGKQLLDAGEFTISEIAYKIGFGSSGYFSTCFKEKYKFSPSEYLKRHKMQGLHPGDSISAISTDQ